MLRPRSAVLVLLVALVAWLVTAYLSAGRDLPTAQARLGHQLADVGLPGLGALLLSGAANGYRAQVARLPGAPSQALIAARTRLGECDLALADIFRRRGNLPRARYHLLRARDRVPEVATTAACRLAELDASTGDQGRARAKRDLLKLYLDHPADPLPSYLVGALFLQEGKAREAAHYLGLSLKAPGGERFETWVALARAARDLRQEQEAVASANRALVSARTPTEKRQAAELLAQLRADHPHPWLAAAGAFVEQHRWGLLSVVVLALVLFYPSLLHSLGRRLPAVAAPLYLLARSTEPSAVVAYEAALRRRPNSARLLEVLARAYRHIGVGTQKAAEVHERLWLLRPNDPRVTADTARLALQSGRMTDPAVQACQVWFDANPDHPDALAVAAHLGRAYRLRGAHAPRSALPALRAALDAAPNDRDLRAYLGALYSHHGEHAAAAEVLWPLVVADPHDQAARQELAHALIGQGRAYEAYRHLRLLPPSAELATDLYLAAVAADQAGRHQESLRILEEVIRLDPSLFDVEERVAAAAARVDRDRCGPLRLQETVAVHEAWVLRRAHHDDHGPVLALLFRREFSDALAFPDLFAERLPILSGLREGSAEVLAGGSHEEAYFVAYRPPAGQQLSELMDTRGLLAPVEAAEVMIPLLEALAALHAAGAVHGDLRPTSIWIEPGRRATLIGAGLAAVAEAAPGMTPPGGRSPFSVAPEVVQGYPCTPLADLYSAGCLLYELLVGSPPLEGPTHLATVMAQVTVEPEPPSMKVPAVPEGMDRLVMAALAKDPSYRVASAEDLADHLRAFVEQPRAPEAPAPPPTVPDATPSWGRTQSRPATPADPSRWWTFYDDTVLLAAARFAKVYRGVYRPTGEHHAIKHLQAPRPGASVSGVQAARAAEAVRRLFLNEIHLLQSLAEDPPPGVVRLAQAYRADERSPAYAMTLLGETLAQRVEQVGPLPEPEALALLREVGAALGALHQRGLVHRNLSPTSVLFAPDGRACLAGFDRACALADRGPMLLAEREAQSASHAPTDAIGDPRFLAPEQCRGEEFDVRTDVYSLGCLLYYLLTASAPFERSDPIQVMLDHLSSAPPRLRDWGLVVAPKTQELLDRALAKSPADRYPDVETMLRAW